MRSLFFLLALAWVGCGPSNRGSGDDDLPDSPPKPDACTDGLRCKVVDCQKTGRTDTTITGTVFAPNGTLPLHGVTVYVPNKDPGFFEDGVKCTRCNPDLPGDPIAQTISAEDGKFTLSGVPVGENIPLIVTVGKWRRQVVLPRVEECAENTTTADQTRLPARKSEGEMPKIAMVTGNCDALECLVRKIGVADSEFTPDNGNGRVHLFAANGANKTANNIPFAAASTLWESAEKMKQYDLALMSCECSEAAAGKSQNAMNEVKKYADAGGRLFLSHYHRIWIDGNKLDTAHAPPAPWPEISQCSAETSGNDPATIDQVNNPRGMAFAKWMLATGGSTTLGVIPISDGKKSCSMLDETRADRWTSVANGAAQIPQTFQFTTPNEAMEEERCGKVVFTDMHVASGSSSPSTGFPGGCTGGTTLSPQEKALAFMFFDIASCVGVIE